MPSKRYRCQPCQEMTEAQHATWIQLSVDVHREYSEPVTHLFSKYGDGRVYVGEVCDWDADESDLHEEASDIVTVTAYLANDHTVEHRKGMIDIGLRLIGQLTAVGETKERVVRSEEWSSQTFPVTRIGESIVVAPTDITDASAGLRPRDVRISLAPGLAFGTGTHPTTRLCLEQLEREATTGALKATDILDVGCGSGILAITALKLEARRAWCIDSDETAIRATAMNIRSSGVEDRAVVLAGGFPNDRLVDRKFGLVLANITSRVLEDMAPQLCARVAKGGILIISGILDDRGRETVAAFEACGMTVTERRADSDWLMFRLVPNADT